MKKNKIFRQVQDRSGFTLFELLVSISIIGILTALASVAFSGAQKKARDARRVQDIKAIQTAAEQYYSQHPNYNYPNSYNKGDVWTPVAGGAAVLESYPGDPKSGSYTCGTTCGITGYCVCAEMENPANANANGSCNFNPTGEKSHFCAKNQQ